MILTSYLQFYRVLYCSYGFVDILQFAYIVTSLTSYLPF